MRKTEAPWLMTSKSIARALDFDAKLVNPEKMGPLAAQLEAKTRSICEKLTERSLHEDTEAAERARVGLGTEQ